MARDGQRKGRGCLITLVVVVLLAAGIWFVGLPIANNKAEDFVDSAVRNAMGSPGMPRVGYRDIQIDATRGQVDIYDLAIPLEEGSSLHAGRIRVTVSPRELVAFGAVRAAVTIRLATAVAASWRTSSSNATDMFGLLWG